MDKSYLPPWHQENTKPQVENKQKPQMIGNLSPRRFSALAIVLALIVAFSVGAAVLFFRKESSQVALASIENNTPYAVKFTEISSDSFVITWKTKEPTIGFIKYGDVSNGLDLIGQQSQNPAEKKLKHEVAVDGLDSGKKYFIEIHSNALGYGKDGEPITVVTLE